MGLYSILMAVDVLLAIGVIGLVLIQHGKGADAGAAFGSGASSTVFGSRGSASFLTRATAILAALFFINSLLLAYIARNQPTAQSVVEQVAPESAPVQPVLEETSAPADIPVEAVSDPGATSADQSATEDSEPVSQPADIPQQ